MGGASVMVGLAIVAALATSVSQPVPPPPNPMAEVKSVVDSMTLPGMTVDLKYIDCGFINAAYFPVDQYLWWGEVRLIPARTIVVCSELLREDVHFLRFIVAHEMSHAVIHQWRIPTTGSEEAAADELAAVLLAADGHVDDVEAAGQWFHDHDSHDAQPEDEHPTDARRSWILKCYAAGTQSDGSAHCRRIMSHAVLSWVRLLAGAE